MERWKLQNYAKKKTMAKTLWKALCEVSRFNIAGFSEEKLEILSNGYRNPIGAFFASKKPIEMKHKNGHASKESRLPPRFSRITVEKLHANTKLV